MSETKGKGWHGDTPGHREAAFKAKADDTLKTPMVERDRDYGRDYRIDIKGIVVIPSRNTPRIFFRTEQAKWDERISPTVPKNLGNRYHKSMLITEEAPEFQKNKEEFKWWKPLKDNISALVKKHGSEIPKGMIPKISLLLMKRGYNTDESLSAEYNRIVGVGIDISRGLYETYIVTESYQRNETFKRTLKSYSISEMGSPFIERMLNRYPNRQFIVEFYNAISGLVHRYQVFLLGREGLRDYYETAEDRRLVEALSHGAIMDEEGYIVDPVTGDKF